VEAQDWRLAELERLGAAERQMESDLVALRDSIARLVVELLPPHASGKRVEEVVVASGFSRTLIEALRGGQGRWRTG
jgi:hypothetical protein